MLLRGIDRLVEGEAGADQSEVGECLGKVAQRLAGGADLFGEQAHVIAQAQQLLQANACLHQHVRPGQGSHARQALDEPEAAGAKGALDAALQPIVCRRAWFQPLVMICS